MRNDPREGGLLAGELAAARSKPPRLKTLDLSGNRLTAGSLAPLVSSEAVATVEDLDLSDNNPGAEGVAVLAPRTLPGASVAAPASHAARRMKASRRSSKRPISSPNCEACRWAGTTSARPPRPSSRTAGRRIFASWTFARTASGDRGAVGLGAKAHLLTNLIELDLAESHVGDAGVKGILSSPFAERLLFLNLTGSPASTETKRLLKREGWAIGFCV